MYILNALLLLGAALLLHFIIERAVRKKLQIEKKQSFANYEHVNAFHRLVEFILIVLYFSAGIIVSNSSNSIASLYTTILLFFLSLFGFRFFMEWKMDRQSKRYLLTLSNFLFLISLAFIIKLLPLDYFL